MGQKGLTSETAKKAGRLSKPGKHRKTKQWEMVSEKFTGEFADEVIDYLNDLKETDKKKFFEAYKDLLNYFKPKMQSVDNSGGQHIKITIEGADGLGEIE